MAITRKKKEELLAQYKDILSQSVNVAILKQEGLSVSEATQMRIAVKNAGGQVQVVKKRVFLKSATESDYEAVELDVFDGSIFAVYAKTDAENEYAPLKVVSKYVKEAKKKKDGPTLEYIGGWYEKAWKDAEYVSDIADLPTKDELVSKFLFLLQYPVQAAAQVLDQIAGGKGDKSPAEGDAEPTEAKAEETKDAPVEESKEEVKTDEVKEEAKAE